MEKAQEIAVKLFAIHPQINKLYITTDGQGFSDLANAESHSRTLKNDKVVEFDRNVTPAKVETKTESDKNREALITEYTELFGKKPNHNIGTDTLRQKIADEKTRLEAAKTTGEDLGGNDANTTEETITDNTVDENLDGNDTGTTEETITDNTVEIVENNNNENQIQE
ncbi:MAG: hypothetical protein KGV59_07360 [Tenacibaculum sp.]|nr:hypothetical protein [Tenacibaculum sp.]